jgi:lipocalin
MNNSRYPYTYSADFVREGVSQYEEIAGERIRVPSICRSQASQAVTRIAGAIGMTHEELSRKLADAFLKEHDLPDEQEGYEVDPSGTFKG